MESMAEVFVVSGLAGKKILKGSIPVRGAKNAALKMLSASLLFSGDVSYERVPMIEDIHRLLDLLKKSGITSAIEKNKKQGDVTLTLSVPRAVNSILDREIAKRLRASIVLTGPMLARMKKVSFPHPGGCVIGERPIDLFLEGYQAMSAHITTKKGMYIITAPKSGLKGASLFFRTPSVTGTETFLMAAVLAQGTTVIANAAMEPEIVALAEWLNDCGADIVGAGTPTITIRGGGLLVARKKGVIVPDRIEAGSFLILGALLAKDLRVTDCEPAHLESLITTLRHAGVSCEVSLEKKEIHVRAPKNPTAVSIKTHEYPGFPTDLQAPMTIFLTQAKGESLVFETIFEGRLSYVDSLVRMGANIKTMDPHRVLVSGPTPLRGKLLESPDLRAGLAYVIAAAVASGESVIHQVYNIDRGYEHIEKRLSAIGLHIRRSSI
jgi:UDP-N-acetylglucosamine 1-carboxyvinyltransferase